MRGWACARRGSTWCRSGRACSVPFALARLGSARLGSVRLGSARLGSARLGSARLSSARLGVRLSGRLGGRLGSAARVWALFYASTSDSTHIFATLFLWLCGTVDGSVARSCFSSFLLFVVRIFAASVVCVACTVILLLGSGFISRLPFCMSGFWTR